MTDNRTSERLRKLLTKRGIKYRAIGRRLTYWNRDGSRNNCDDADFVADEQNGYLTVEGLTPEQAIAATLGNTKYVYALRGTDPSAMPSYGGETNELLGIYATRKAAEKAKVEYREYCDLDITECEVMGR